MDFSKMLNSGVSRRRFMKGALAGAGAVAASSHFNIAEALARQDVDIVSIAQSMGYNRNRVPAFGDRDR